MNITQGRKTRYDIEIRDPDGNLIAQDTFYNLVVTEGLNHSIDTQFNGSAYTASWYVGITGGTPSFAAGDTMSSHAGWTEVTAYDETTRQTLTLSSASSGSADNSASKAVFTINANGTTVGGAFIVTDNTKGGTTGTLYGGGAFTQGDQTIGSGSTVTVTVTISATSS